MVCLMQQFVTGFWGCFFGTAALMLAGSIFVFTRELQRIGANAALSALVSAFFALGFLGGLPIDDADVLARFLAHLAAGVSAVLIYLLFFTLDLLHPARFRHGVMATLAVLAAAVMAIGWLVSPWQALALGVAQTWVLALVALVFGARSALRGDRLGWLTVAGVFFMLVALVGLGWIALDREHVQWPVHVMSAMAGTVYMAIMALVLWSRYAYLLELRQVMAYGPGYDPVTRMRSHAETGQMLGIAFRHYREEPVPLGVIVLSVANLNVLEKLHGRAAANHALFVCASRLRRAVPADVEMGRLADDSFLLLVRNCTDSGRLIALARLVQAHLSKSVALNTCVRGVGQRGQQTRWAAEVGAGVLRASGVDARASRLVAMARGISRAAWSYPSRVGWLDESSGDIVGMPVLRPV